MSQNPILAAPCYVVSDHHFGVVPREAEHNFLTFLDRISGTAGSLVINGDLFDFWFEWRTVIPRDTFRVLAALDRVVRSGTPVLWIGGNHDCWGGEVLSRDVGVHYMLGAWEGDVAGWRTRIEHGDGLRPEADRKYRALRSVIRHPAAIAAMRLLHPDVGSWIATRSSGASRDHRARDGGEELRKVAHALLAGTTAPDIYLLGHTHVPVLERSPSGGIYANPGSWSEDGSHVVITDRAVRLQTFDPSVGENCLHVVDR